MPGENSEKSRAPSTIEDLSPGDDPVHEEPQNDQFESMVWSEWPRWTGYGIRRTEIFAELLEPMLDLDTKQCAVWKEEVQNLLILAGLFSAVVTAFIIESLQTLQPDPNDQIIALLSRILDQTNATIGNASPHTTFLPTISGFVPSPSNIRVNIYWFLSLVLSLTVALIGIIAQQWMREHQLYKKGSDAYQQFALFDARSDGLKRWYVPQIFAGLPLLLQAALVLFFIGLVEFLFSIQIDVAIPVFAAVSVPIVFLVATTILPTQQLYTMHFPYFLRMNDRPPAPCPYKSPQALIFQNAAILSASAFNLSARAFSILWIPFVIVMRCFVSNGKPFYGKGAPFSTDDADYQCCRNRLRNTAREWMTMDMQWLATRTSYAVAIHTPITVRHLQRAYINNTNLTEAIGFYDWVTGIKQVASSLDPTDSDHKQTLALCLDNSLEKLFNTWDDPIQASRTDPEFSRALQTRFAALLRIISPYSYQQTANLVGLCDGDSSVAYNAFTAIFMDQAWGTELNFHHQYLHIRLATHMKMTRLYLLSNAHELFRCFNLAGITPSFSLSARFSLAYHRCTLEGQNQPWMQCISRDWSETLRQVIMDVCEMSPSQPFTGKCTGSSTSRCGSNLHTESIVELTEYILIFQVRDDIQQTLCLLHDLCVSKTKPVQERPFVLITACAYINAVANVNLDDVEGFSMLLRTLCELCGAQTPTLEARPGGKGQHWPSLEFAFDFIRNNACNQQVGSAAVIPQAPGLPHNADAAEIA